MGAVAGALEGGATTDPCLAFDEGPRQYGILSGSVRHPSARVPASEGEQGLAVQDHRAVLLAGHAWARAASDEPRAIAATLMAALPSAPQGEPASLLELLAEADAVSLDDDEAAQTAEAEQPAQRVRARGQSIKKRKRSRKPGNQRVKHTGS